MFVRSPAAGRLCGCHLPASVGDLPDCGLCLNSIPGSGPGFPAPHPPPCVLAASPHRAKLSVSQTLSSPRPMAIRPESGDLKTPRGTHSEGAGAGGVLLSVCCCLSFCSSSFSKEDPKPGFEAAVLEARELGFSPAPRRWEAPAAGHASPSFPLGPGLGLLPPHLWGVPSCRPWELCGMVRVRTTMRLSLRGLVPLHWGRRGPVLLLAMLEAGRVMPWVHHACPLRRRRKPAVGGRAGS